MAIFKHQLKNYPELKNWFENEIIHNSNKKSPSYIKHYTNDFQIKVCQSLNLQDKFSYFAWTDALSSLISNSRELEKDFNKCISFFSYYGLDLSLLTSDMAFLSFQLDDARSYLTLIQKIADKTELISFRFLCAWLALNLDDLELCIDECEKIDTPYAPIYTILGQALLEKGQAVEAVECLKIAISIDPHEILAYFQLAKANLVISRSDAAWEAANKCITLQGKSMECLLLLAMIAIESRDSEKISIAWNHLAPHLSSYPESPVLIASLFDLAFLNKNNSWATTVIQHSNWNSLFANTEFLKKLGPILRRFAELEWYSLSEQLLGKFSKNTG